MKSFKVFTLIILILVTFNADISAKLSSRIEGRVVDYDTGEPLRDVEVLLYYYKEKRSVANRITKTDTKGCFSISPRSKLPRRFFMNFKKQGYCDFIKKSAYESSKNPQKTLNLATIAEGERRFFDIKLRKGCLIKGTVFLKDQAGIRPIIPTDEFYPDNVEINICRIATPEERNLYPSEWIDYDKVFLDKKGNYFINGVLPSQSYSVWYSYKEFATRFKNLEVTNAKTLEMNHTFDNTDNTGISLRVQKNNKPVHADIQVAKPSEGLILGALKFVDGRYVMKNMLPGTYQLYLSVYLADKSINKVIPVKLENGVTELLDLNY